MVTISSGARLGRYEIRSKLGAGGMGEVYLAHDNQLNRPVALKLLPLDLSSDADRLRRFGQEAKAASRPGSIEREEKLKALINLLEPDTQVYIRSLPREHRIEAITKKIKEQNDATEAALARQKLKQKLCWWR